MRFAIRILLLLLLLGLLPSLISVMADRAYGLPKSKRAYSNANAKGPLHCVNLLKTSGGVNDELQHPANRVPTFLSNSGRERRNPRRSFSIYRGTPRSVGYPH